MNKNRLYPWLIWFVAALFLSFQFILRLACGLIMPQIMEKFQINTSNYGLLSSMYYFGYAGAQIPVALLLDRFGPKKMISLCALICGIGTYLFANTYNWNVLLFARFITGVGSAAAFLGVSKVISITFARSRYSNMIGFSITIGLLGAIYGGNPVSLLITQYGWEQVLEYLSLAATGIAATIFILLKNPTAEEKSVPKISMADLKSILQYKPLLVLAASSLLMVGPLEGFADVWGISYFMKCYKLGKDHAALITSMIFSGMMLGGPLLASIANRYKAHLEVTIGCGLVMATIFTFMLKSGDWVHPYFLGLLMFITGIVCCYQILIFALGAETVPPQLMGVTVAFLNCIIMVGGSFFHSVIGWQLDLFWSGTFENGNRLYHPNDYVSALWIIPLAALVGSIVLIITRKNYRVMLITGEISK